MAYSAFAVANAFIERAEQGRIPDLTPMKLQKLMYYAQALHLKVFDAPLLDDNFVRWQYGPVIPAVYHEFKAFGATPITGRAITRSGPGFGGHIPTIPHDDIQSWKVIDAIIEGYGSLEAHVLAYMTHVEGSAWEKGGGPTSTVITPDEILNDSTIFSDRPEVIA